MNRPTDKEKCYEFDENWKDNHLVRGCINSDNLFFVASYETKYLIFRLGYDLVVEFNLYDDIMIYIGDINIELKSVIESIGKLNILLENVFSNQLYLVLEKVEYMLSSGKTSLYICSSNKEGYIH